MIFVANKNGKTKNKQTNHPHTQFNSFIVRLSFPPLYQLHHLLVQVPQPQTNNNPQQQTNMFKVKDDYEGMIMAAVNATHSSDLTKIIKYIQANYTVPTNFEKV